MNNIKDLIQENIDDFLPLLLKHQQNNYIDFKIIELDENIKNIYIKNISLIDKVVVKNLNKIISKDNFVFFLENNNVMSNEDAVNTLNKNNFFINNLNEYILFLKNIKTKLKIGLKEIENISSESDFIIKSIKSLISNPYIEIQKEIIDYILSKKELILYCAELKDRKYIKFSEKIEKKISSLDPKDINRDILFVVEKKEEIIKTTKLYIVNKENIDFNDFIDNKKIKLLSKSKNTVIKTDCESKSDYFTVNHNDDILKLVKDNFFE